MSKVDRGNRDKRDTYHHSQTRRPSITLARGYRKTGIVGARLKYIESVNELLNRLFIPA
jgi:hypothetical protein